ncbi:MAG: hypothetical protein LBM13_01605 [Candidatus Ancillula sp.]|nr:hypothetical protein [Candidatus Ancillula sp.]
MPNRFIKGCILVVFLAVAVFLIYPSAYVEESPGDTYNILGNDNSGKKYIDFPKADENEKGELMLLTVAVSGASTYFSSATALPALFQKSSDLYPREAYYPPNTSNQQVQEKNAEDMQNSESSALIAAKNYLKEKNIDFDDKGAKIQIDDVGGPSAGLVFTLGILQKAGIDITQGRRIAVTGTIDNNGKVGAIGGVQQKMIAAYRDGASVMVVPKENISELEDIPNIEIIAVDNLSDAVNKLTSNN